MTAPEETISQELLEILACPDCKGDIEYDRENQKLICVGECQRRYPHSKRHSRYAH